MDFFRGLLFAFAAEAFVVASVYAFVEWFV